MLHKNRRFLFWAPAAGLFLIAGALAQSVSPPSSGGGGSPSGAAGDIQTYATSSTFGHITPGTGVETWLATPSFSNLNSALTGDSAVGLAAVQTISGAKTFGEVHGTTYTPTLTTNNYTVQQSDCGKTLLLPTGTTPTVTLPNLNSACTIAVVQSTATQYTIQAASGGTLVSVNSYTKTKAQYAILFLTIIVPSASAATWDLAGDGS